MGHQLNPRWGKFDFKFFFEVRPGLIGWVGKTFLYYFYYYLYIVCYIWDLFCIPVLYRSSKCVHGTPEYESSSEGYLEKVKALLVSDWL